MKAATDRMSHPAAAVEVLVIGSGVIGSSIAYHVARQGRKVLVVERHEVAVEPSASWASAGGVRPQGLHPAEAALASAALARWPTLAEELDADLQYRQGGHLLLAENEVEAAYLQTFVPRQHELGFADVSFVVIGSVSGFEGLTLALGSWYGFALAPAVGSFVADHLAGRPTPELDQLTPNRIAQFDPAQIAAFLAEPATSNVAE